jgi:hypothetical protein
MSETRRFNFVPGYASTLVRHDVKDLLTTFRRQHGYAHSEHIERCLSSACIELCLSDESLRARILDCLDLAVATDARLIRSVGAESPARAQKSSSSDGPLPRQRQ